MVLDSASIPKDFLGRALEVLEDHLDVIESTRTKTSGAKHTARLGIITVECMTTTKSIVHYERQLSIAKEIKDAALEAEALYGLGYNPGRLCDYDKAMEYLEQGLVPLSDTGDIPGQGRAYSYMGDVLLAQDGREQEAIEMLQKANGILEPRNDPEAMSLVLCKLGEAYMRIEAWDNAIIALEKGISISASMEFEVIRNQLQSELHQVLGRTYLEQY